MIASIAQPVPLHLPVKASRIGAARRELVIIHLQVVKAPHHLVKVLAVGLVEVVPQDRLGSQAAIGSHLTRKFTGIDRVVVTQFPELPDHLGPRQRKHKQGGQFRTVEGRGQQSDIIATFRSSPVFAFQHDTLLIMAFHVGDQMGMLPSAVFIESPSQIGSVPLGGIGIGKMLVSPEEDTMRGQLLLLAVVGEMLEDHQGMGVAPPYLVSHPLQVGNTGGIIGTPPVALAIHRVGKSLGEVKAEPVDLVLLHPEAVDAVDELAGVRAFVIEIVSPLGIGILEVVLGVVPRILSRGLPGRAVEVHLHQGALTVTVVEHHVDHHGHAPLVGLVDQAFQVIAGAIILVGGKIKGGVVAPAQVPLELVDGH